MNVYEIEFNGAVLHRGFWIYVWMIITEIQSRLIYVGRTGDTSSPNAQSPFRRVGQHVDPNPKSKSNALARNLQKRNIDPETCHFKFTAIGPIYPECEDMESHIPVRDKIAALERRTADWFHDNKYDVLGIHPKPSEVDENAWVKIKRELLNRF